MPRPLAAVRLLFAAALCLVAALSHAEPGGKPELAPGQSVTRDAAASGRAVRLEAWRALARAQAAELDSLGALAAAAPADAGRLQREIEAAKRRHVRDEIELQRTFALRAGNAALARRLALRLERLELANGGAR